MAPQDIITPLVDFLEWRSPTQSLSDNTVICSGMSWHAKVNLHMGGGL